MDRGSLYTSSMMSSFSLPSLAEGSEYISEAEEINEVKSLMEKGNRAAKIKEFKSAIAHYNEALEIDDLNTAVLQARALALLQCGQFAEALVDAEKIIAINPGDYHGHLLLGVALQNQDQNKEALTSYLTALELDSEDNTDKITNHIASVCSRFCDMPPELVKSLKDMDPYKKLSEVGVCLHQAKRYQLCIKVLEAAQKFQTNQKGITMRIYLTLANSYSSLRHTEQAISLYQECCSLAVATHDHLYQTKSLVNIASLYLESKDTHQAIVYYEKLLHLQAELLAEAGSMENMPEFWTKELQCGLHLNLSIAYKTIGNMYAAVKHARRYAELVEKYGIEGRPHAESYHNSGMLQEILGKYQEALEDYKKYLALSKKNKDQKGIGQPYGCLGSVYAALCNWPLSISYHEQYLKTAIKLKDRRMMAFANEMLADTLASKEDHAAAISFYEAMLSCVRHDVKLKASALCKLGDSYRALGRNQYSLYFFEQASEIAEDYDFEDIQTLADFNIACIHQNSTQMQDMESARKAFQKLIPFFEMKIREHNEESSHCPDKYHEQLTKCYDGLQLVHSKSGNKEECLQLAEAHRKRNVTQLPNFSLLGPGGHTTGLHRDFWAMDRILRVVSEQSATVLYYSLFDSCLLLWVLEPGQGIARFYSKNAVSGNMRAQVEELIQELRAGWDWEGREAEFDMRALPPKDLELQRIRDKNLKLKADGGAPPKPQGQEKPDATKDKTTMDSLKEDTDKTTSAKKITEDLIGTGDKAGKTLDDSKLAGVKTDSSKDVLDKTDSNTQEEEDGEKGGKDDREEHEKAGEEKKDKEKTEMEKEVTSTSRSITRLFLEPKQRPASRKLFDLLLAPIEDILGEKAPNSPLVIIPDKELHRCPFHILRDWRDDTLGSRFQISYLPCLLLLERVVQNEQELLRIEDELEFERVQARKGGIYRLLTQQGGQVSPRFTDASTISSVDKSSTVPELVFPPRVSNPRLLTSSVNVSNCNSARQKSVPMGITREDTFFSLGSTRKPQKDLGSRQRQRTRTPESQINCASGEHGWILNTGQGDTSPPPPMPASTNIPLKMLHRLGCPVPPEKMMSAHTFSTLTTRTSTGTDITQSEVSVVPFTQISNQDHCVVYGAPKLPHSLLLHGRPWHPGGEMLTAAREARKVARMFDVTPVLGEFATKDQFLEDLQKASVIHIATFGCWREGYLVMAPNMGAEEEGPPQERTYLVTTADILAVKLKAQLVVLSLGHSPYSHTSIPPGHTLPAAFLAAGALSVLVHAWPLPSTVLDKFYFHFYSALQSPSHLSLALQAATSALQCDDTFSHVYSWGGFFLIGKDMSVSLQKVRHDMLHQLLDKVEQDAEERVPKPLLNPRQLVPSVRTKDEHLDSIQKYMRDVLHMHTSHPQITSGLIDLLDAALKRLHTEEINRQTSRLSESVAETRQAMELLKYLGFHFQPKGASPQSPYVVFPHWNREELLIPCYDALRAVTEIAANKECCQALCDVLPLSQDNISLVIDLLSITRHAPEVQLKVTDLSVRPLWGATKTRAMLAAAGFHQVGLLLNFNMEPRNKTLLTALLQFLLAMSCHKSQVLLYRLDVNLLGRPSASKASLRDSLEFHKLPSLTPLILPRNQLRMCTPWLSSVERTDEMREKMKLAKSKSQMEENFADYLERARSWHQTTLTAQANEELHRYGRPRTTPQHVMVIPGPTMSHPKTPVSQEARLKNPESDQRRDYAHFILQQRIDNINVHRKNEIIKMYQPYTKA